MFMYTVYFGPVAYIFLINLCYAGVLTIGGWGHKHICHISKGVEELFPAGFEGL